MRAQWTYFAHFACVWLHLSTCLYKKRRWPRGDRLKTTKRHEGTDWQALVQSGNLRRTNKEVLVWIFKLMMDENVGEKSQSQRGRTVNKWVVLRQTIHFIVAFQRSRVEPGRCSRARHSQVSLWSPLRTVKIIVWLWQKRSTVWCSFSCGC